MVTLKVTAEDVEVYLKNKKKYVVRLTSNDGPLRAIQLVAHQMRLLDIAPHLELCEDAMGKGSSSSSSSLFRWFQHQVERILKDDDKLLDLKSKWSSNNPLYFRFLLKPQRGASEKVQMSFRDVMYS